MQNRCCDSGHTSEAFDKAKKIENFIVASGLVDWNEEGNLPTYAGEPGVCGNKY